MKRSKQALLHSAIALLLCISMFVSTTFAWFTDSVTSQNNLIVSGNLDAELEWRSPTGQWLSVNENTNVFEEGVLWEPGHTEVVYLRVSNKGSLAFKYQLGVNVASETQGTNVYGEKFQLSDHIWFGMITKDVDEIYLDRDSARQDVTNPVQIRTGLSKPGSMEAGNPNLYQYITLVVYMPESVGNEANYKTGTNPPVVNLGITLVASQYTSESDSFGPDYDQNAQFPVLKPGNVAVDISGKVDANSLLTEDVLMVNDAGNLAAIVPAGTKVTGNSLSLRVSELSATGSNVQLQENEILRPLDVHIDGIAADNTVPARITVKEAMMTGLNIGNYALYHVEGNDTNAMTPNDLTVHNGFTYDPATGDLTLAMKSFSEVAVVAEPAKWEGEFDYSWYTNAVAPADGEAVTEYTIANADQLAAFGAIVGGMNGQTQDSFAGKTVKLVADINLGDKESENNPNVIFYPIGYYNSEGTYKRTNTAITSGLRNFEGTFDGNGHTVSNFYQNTWEMKGDHDWYSPEEQYYRDGMGLFGRVYKGTVKNLTVKNFSSDGEIATTGVIAAYADGATFENIAIMNCNPRVYNIGNGGIVGCVGWYAKEADLKTTFKNITVDNSNKISALWGSYDVACGGIVGQYYPTSGQSSANYPVNGGIDFVNCHISAQMDVYNDVCANYQYYAYRYAGMIIGSIRENTTTVIDGVTKTIPDMTGITATGCTVNYGDWNDYYYCEFVSNGHPSYSGENDYKFSRVPHSELKFEDKNNNGLVDADERDTVTGCNHNHTDAEDNQAVFLPFYQLFTGYGWGVNSIGLEKYSGIITNLDITEGEQQGSVEKFTSKIDNNNPFDTETTVRIGDLFDAIVGEGKLEIMSNQVMVAVNPAVGSTAGGVYTPASPDDEGNVNWKEGTLTFSGVGKATITITDYYFCTPTTIEVEILSIQKFETKFTGDFLYRVGNASNSTVALGTMFAAGDNVTDSSVDIAFDTIKGNASGVYTGNTAEWEKGTIQFSGTGVVKVTIGADGANPVSLYLEVIDAENLTSAKGTTTGGNFVLLCDVNSSTYVNYWNCTLYGNGFTYSLKGAPTAYNSKQGKGIIITKNTTLDNLVVIGDVYNGYGAFTNNDYYNTVIDITGDTVIQNCYISGCAAPVRARNNVTIINSTLYGGAVANLIIESGTVTLEDVTTANYDDGRKMVGMGIVVHPDATEAAKLVLNGTLTQYNFISEGNVPTDTYAKNLHEAMFSNSCSTYHFGTSPNRYVNTGIISLASTFNNEDITDNANTGYSGKKLNVSSYDGYVYTQPNTSGSVNNGCHEYKPTTQGAVPPSYSFDYSNKNYVAKTDGSNDYCYEENGKVNISMDEGDTFNWDTSILTIGKGITNYTVTMNGADYSGKCIAFNKAGDYEVKYTYIDSNNYKLDEDGNITAYSVTYTKTVNITVAVVKATTKHAEFTFGSSNTASTTVTIGNNTYVMPNVSGTSSTIGSTTVDGKTIYYPIVEIVMSDGKTSHTSGWYAYFPVFSGAVTITDYADKGTGAKMPSYNGSTTTMPSGLTVVGDPKTLFKYQSGSNAGENPVVKNNILVYSSAKIEAKRSEYNTVIQYSYTDNAGATYYYYVGYHAPAQSYTSCVTGDTLVTLADGTQKRIDAVTYADQLLVWDFYKGQYAVVPAAIIFDHGYDYNTVIKLNFSDGTSVKVVNLHQFFDADLNKFVSIDAESVADYVGHKFVKQNGEDYELVTLVDYTSTEEYCEAWGIISAEHYNIIVEGMLSADFMKEDFALFNYFQVGQNMKFDEVQMQAEIEKYGLYTYADFEQYLTREQFDAFNVQYFKIAVGKGEYTYDGILALIETYLKN